MYKVRISVVVPFYNVGLLINECLRSLLNQSQLIDEIILVDDGSTDESSSIAQCYASQNSNLKLIRQQNKGLLAARRTGFRYASGDYIANVDGDDIVSPDYCRTIKQALYTTDADILFLKCKRFRGDLSWLKCANGGLSVTKIEKDKLLTQMCTTSKFNSLCLKVVRSSCIDSHNDYSKFGRVNQAEDLLQSVSMVIQAKTFFELSDKLYGYRVRPGSITSSGSMLDSLDEVLVCRAHFGENIDKYFDRNHPASVLWRRHLVDTMFRVITGEVRKFRVDTLAMKNSLNTLKRTGKVVSGNEGGQVSLAVKVKLALASALVKARLIGARSPW